MQFDKAYFLERFSSLDTLVLRQKAAGDLTPEALAAIETILQQREHDPDFAGSEIVEKPVQIELATKTVDASSCIPTKIVARYWTLQEAEIVRGLLETEGVPAILADAYLIPLNSFLVVVFGGVKVKVPPICVASAHQILAKLKSGEYELGQDAEDAEKEGVDKEMQLARYKINDNFRNKSVEPACWNPDVAAALGMIFSPIFSQLIHFLNWRILGDKNRARNSLLWAGGSLLLLVGAEYLVEVDGVEKLFGGGALWVWYFFSGRKQSTLLVNTLGNSYLRKDFTILLIVMVVMLTLLRLF